MEPRKTTSVIIPLADGKFLGVSRKYDHNSFGFAGGKCEGDESSIRCAYRETLEETGFRIINMNLIDVREYLNRDDNVLDMVYCFVVRLVQGYPHTNEELLERGEGIIKAITREELLAGAFGDYNVEILKVYDKFRR